MPDDFRLIRPWNGLKDRAFEEICYQILREEEDLPDGMVAPPTRTGNPDGGVEWYVKISDDTQWGWQAKYIYDINTLLTAMTATVKRVVKERPNLTKLTFCIPYNLPANTSEGQRKSARQRYEDAVESWKKSVNGADKIDFKLLQESDLLARLAMPKHAGRVWFWWHEPYLGPGWLATFQHDQATVAGDRYRPLLQVDVPIQDDVSALGFSKSYFDDLARHARKAIERLKELSVPAARLGDAVTGSAQRAVDAAAHLVSLIRSTDYQADQPHPLDDLDQAVVTCIKAVSEASKAAWSAEATASKDKRVDGRPSDSDLLNSHAYRLRLAGSTLDSLRQYLDGSASRALRKRFYFLAGSAGSGKTHLCLDSVQRALEEGRPAVVLFGNQFGASDLWMGICDQLGLPPLGADTLLGAMEAAAEASGLTGHRFVLMIDALNDTRTQDYWESRLSALRAKFAGRPLLSLLVSCRDTYLNYVDPEERCKDAIRRHPGFTGREIEATHKYFTHYGLREPRIPLLLPEFTVPLFLVTYCEGLQGEGLNVPPAGHEGRIEIFERFLKVQLDRVTRRLGLPPGSAKARAALDALLDEMGANGVEHVLFDRADDLASACIPERTEWPRTALGALLSEGLLNDEPTYTHEGRHDKAVRVTYQAFSDFLILQRRLRLTPEGQIPDTGFTEWLYRASWGIREAAAMLLPERYGVELPDLLEPVIRQAAADRRHGDQQVQHELDNLDEMAARSFPYRRVQAITDRSFEILNRHGRRRGGLKPLLDAAFLCAPQPDSPLNGVGLHDYLSRYSMPDRDAGVGRTLYYELDDKGSPLSRLARWAAAGPYPDYEPPVIELACIPLVWMLSSPNRFARDWITKALAQLLAGHLDAAAALVERFATVDDPYVLERLITAVYGGMLRGGVHHLEEAARLAGAVERCIFARLGALNPDALMLDAARGIIEWAVAHEVLPSSALAAAQPSYGFKRPANPPTRERLDALYPHGEGTTDQTSYASVYLSVLSFGDFARYVIESGMRYFLRVPRSKPLPQPDPPVKPKFLVTKWGTFRRSLSTEQRSQLAALLGSDDAVPDDATSDIDEQAALEFLSSLSPRQDKLFHDSWSRPRRRDRREELSFSADLAQRWVMHRTMTLGWTPQRFGPFDRYLHYNQVDRGSHKYERFGKKYQWIAYHELLARVADNYHFAWPYGDDAGEFVGIHQLNDREIDPSLPPVPYREFQERIVDQGTWPPLSIKFSNELPGSVAFDRYAGDFEAFLNDQASLPYPDAIARIKDRHGEPWIILYAHAKESQHADADERAHDTDEQFFTLSSWLVNREHTAEVMAALPGELRNDATYGELLDRNGHTDCCYVGELGWRDMQCPHQLNSEMVLTLKEDTNLKGIATVEEYTWEGNVWDCSIELGVNMVLPSTFVQRSAGLQWSGADRSWLAGTEPVVCNIDVMVNDGHSTLLLARQAWLHGFLGRQGMDLVYGLRGERQHRGRQPEDYTWKKFQLSGAYDGTNLNRGEPLIERQWNHTSKRQSGVGNTES